MSQAQTLADMLGEPPFEGGDAVRWRNPDNPEDYGIDTVEEVLGRASYGARYKKCRLDSCWAFRLSAAGRWCECFLESVE